MIYELERLKDRLEQLFEVLGKDEITLAEAFKLLGLKEVCYDPWGNGQVYLQWLRHLNPDSISHDMLGFWIHIRTCGTLYFAWTFWAAGKCLDFRSVPGKLIWFFMQTRNLIEDYIYKRLMSEEEKKRYYRVDYTKPLPDGYVGDLWIGERSPLEHLISDTKQIILGRLAREEFLRRKGKHPEIASLGDCIIANSPWLKQEIGDRFPGSPMPDGNKGFGNLWNYAKKTMKGSISIKSIKSVYDFDDVEIDKQRSIFEELQKAGGDNHLASLELDKIMASALDGKLGGYLNQVTIHDITDAARGAKHDKEHEELESQKDAEREAEGAEVTTPFLDTLPAPEPEETLDLKGLGLDIDKLAPAEFSAVMRYLQAFSEGYDLDSKEGESLKQALGNDYEKTKRAFNRAKARLNKP